MRVLLTMLLLFSCLSFGCGDDGEEDAYGDADTDGDSDSDSDSDSDTDTDTDTDADEPSEKWVFVLPIWQDIQEGSDLPIALGSDDTAYVVASAFGNGALLHAVGSDGEQKWENTDLPTAWSDSCIHPVLSEGTSTVYVVCNEEVDTVDRISVYAISTNGSLKWKTDLPEGVTYPQQIALYTDGITPTDHLLISVSTTLPTNGIYEVDSSGVLGPTFLIDSPLYGMAIDAYNNVMTRTKDGRVYKLSPSLSEIWMHTLSIVPATESRWSLSIGNDGTIYVSTDEPRLFAITEDTPGAPYEKWTYSEEMYDLSESISGSDGTVFFYRANKDLVALDPTDGAKIWSAGNSHSYYPAITALEDGTVLAGGNVSYGLYSVEEEFNAWYVNGDGKNAAAVGQDGTIYGMGKFESDYSNAVYAHQWNLAPSGAGWYRGNGNNANTRWVGSY